MLTTLAVLCAGLSGLCLGPIWPGAAASPLGILTWLTSPPLGYALRFCLQLLINSDPLNNGDCEWGGVG